jgi:hypothetical protein
MEQLLRAKLIFLLFKVVHCTLFALHVFFVHSNHRHPSCSLLACSPHKQNREPHTATQTPPRIFAVISRLLLLFFFFEFQFWLITMKFAHASLTFLSTATLPEENCVVIPERKRKGDQCAKVFSRAPRSRVVNLSLRFGQ